MSVQLVLPAKATVNVQQGREDNLPSTSAQTLHAALRSSPVARLLAPDLLRNIAEEAFLCEDITRCSWNFWLSPSSVGNTTGAVSWLGIRFVREGQQRIKADWRKLDAAVQFAQPCNAVARSRKEGSRRYGVCGPRRTHHWTEMIPRGLHEAEIKRVKDLLENSVRAHPLFLATGARTP